MFACLVLFEEFRKDLFSILKYLNQNTNEGIRFFFPVGFLLLLQFVYL